MRSFFLSAKEMWLDSYESSHYNIMSMKNHTEMEDIYMEISTLTEAMATLEWVQEHLDAVGGEHKREYIDGLRSVWELLDLIRKKGDIYGR